MLDEPNFTLEFSNLPESIGTWAIVTVRVLLEDKKPNDVVSYITGGVFRRDVADKVCSKEALGCGLSLVGGVRPVFEKDDERESGVIAYDQDVRLVKWD